MIKISQYTDALYPNILSIALNHYLPAFTKRMHPPQPSHTFHLGHSAPRKGHSKMQGTGALHFYLCFHFNIFHASIGSKFRTTEEIPFVRWFPIMSEQRQECCFSDFEKQGEKVRSSILSIGLVLVAVIILIAPSGAATTTSTTSESAVTTSFSWQSSCTNNPSVSWMQICDLLKLITTETANRQAGDTTLQTKINTVTAARNAGDNNLQTAINNIQLKPGAQGPPGPAGKDGATVPFGDWTYNYANNHIYQATTDGFVVGVASCPPPTEGSPFPFGQPTNCRLFESYNYGHSPDYGNYYDMVDMTPNSTVPILMLVKAGDSWSILVHGDAAVQIRWIPLSA
jgi:hypothetical protein